jgi:hypothetical protein
MTGNQIETDPSARPCSEGPIYLDAADLLAPHASVWIFIAAFVGLAVAWRTGAVPVWAGIAIAGGTAFLISAALIALAIRVPDILPGYFRLPLDLGSPDPSPSQDEVADTPDAASIKTAS